jgi:hypothetical protein
LTYIFEAFRIIETLLSKNAKKFIVDFIREGVVGRVKDLHDINKEDFYLPTDYNGIFKEFEKEVKNLEKEKELEKNNINDNKEQKNNFNNGMIIDECTSMNNVQIQNESNNINNISINQQSSLSFTQLSSTDKIYLLTKFVSKQIYEKYLTENNCKILFSKLKILNTPQDPFIIKSNLISISQKISSQINSQYFDKEIIKDLFSFILDQNKITFYEIEKSDIISNLVAYIDNNFKINLLNFGQHPSNKNIKNDNYEKNIVEKLNILFSALNFDIERVKNFISILQYCISSMNCFTINLYEYNSYKNTAHLFVSSYKSQIQKYKINLCYNIHQDTLDEYGLDPVYHQLHLFYSDSSGSGNNSNRILEIDQSENFSNINEAVLKKQYKGVLISGEGENNNFSNFSSSNKIEEELVSTLSMRKGSEDFENTERILSQLIERKVSNVSNIEEEEVIFSNSNNIPLALRRENSLISLSEKKRYKILFYIEINNKRLFVNNKWSLKDLIKEVKSFYTKQEYYEFFNSGSGASYLKINFEIRPREVLLDLGHRRKSSINSISTPVKVTLNYEDSCKEIIKSHSQENYVEEILFLKFYNEKIINNSSLYSVTRVSPFIYLLALFEICINHFGNLFGFKSKLEVGLLENSKISSLLLKQVRDPYAISSNTVPSWCKDLISSFPYLSSFDSKYLFFKTSAFDLKRSMTNLYVYIKNFMGENIIEDKTLATVKRKKFCIDRENIIRSTEKLVRDHGNYNGYMEFEYLNESGSGLGPTLEFYSIFMQCVMSNKNLWYKTSDHSLYPAPFFNFENEKNQNIFYLMGYVVARAMYDDRLIDAPFNSLFWDLVLDRVKNIF